MKIEQQDTCQAVGSAVKTDRCSARQQADLWSGVLLCWHHLHFCYKNRLLLDDLDNLVSVNACHNTVRNATAGPSYVTKRQTR